MALELFEENLPARPVRLIGVRVASFEGVVAERPPAPPPVAGQLELPMEDVAAP